jgi:O-antigen/teichoic acid export membrane protein
VLSGVARVVFQTLSMCIGFFLTPFLVLKLGDYWFGLWTLINTIVVYFNYVDPGMDSALQRFMGVAIGKNDIEEQKKVFTNGQVLNSFFSFTVIVLVSIVSMFILNASFENHELVAQLVFFMGLSLGIHFLFRGYFSVIKANIRDDIIAFVSFIRALLNALLTVYFISKGYSLVALMLITIFASFAEVLIVVLLVKNISSAVKFSRHLIDNDYCWQMLKFSSKSFLMKISNLLKTQIDELVLAKFVSVNMVTYYAIAYRLTFMPFILVYRLFSGTLSYFSQLVGEENREILREKVLFLTKISIPFALLYCAGIFFLGKQFVTLWVGVKYAEVVYLPLILLSIYYSLDIVFIGLGNAITSMNRHKWMSIASIIEGLLNLSLSIYFTAVFGLGVLGVVLGSLVAKLVNVFIFTPIFFYFVISDNLNLQTSIYFKYLFKYTIFGISVYSVLYIIMGSLYLRIDSIYAVFLGVIPLGMGFIINIILCLNKRERALLHQKIFA